MTSPFDAFSSARSSVSSAIWALRRFSTVSLPVISRLSRNCTSAKIDRRKMKTRRRLVRTSTKAGQYSGAADAAARARGHELLSRPAPAAPWRWFRGAPAFRAAARPGSRPSSAPPAARSACAGRGPGCPRRGWPWRWSRAGSTPIAGCAGAAAAPLLDRPRQALDRDAKVFRGRPGAAAALDQVGVEVGDRRQPVLEVVVEHALRLAGLQVEEAEDRASRRGRTARPRRRCPCRRAAPAGRSFRSSKMTPVLPEETSRPLDGVADRARPSAAGPRRCRAGRGR